MVSDGAMAMMCCTTWAGVLPDISARGRRALPGIPLLHPYMYKGISLCTIAFTSTFLTAVDCMVVPVIRFQTTLVRFLVYGSCCDMLHSEVALFAKHWWVDLMAILACCNVKCRQQHLVKCSTLIHARVSLLAAGFVLTLCSLHPHTLHNSFNLYLCTAVAIDPVVCGSIIHIYAIAVE